jgi:hypothetical protein
MRNTLSVPIPERVYDLLPIPDPFHMGMDNDNGYEYPTTDLPTGTVPGWAPGWITIY